MYRFALTFLLLTGCPAPETEDTDDTPSDTSSDTAEDTCDTIQDRAADLPEPYQACTVEVGCEVMDFSELVGPNSCFARFHCAEAFPVGADLAPLAEAAADLTAERDAAACGDCRDDVLCAPAEEFRAECNESTGLCEIVEA
ncbi:MAG: hypothetical protein V4850_07300 [Myxococcota bacterium]